MLTKAKAIAKLQQQISEIPQIKNKTDFSPEFKKWHRDTEVAIENIFGQGTRHSKDFSDIEYGLNTVVTNLTPDSAFRQAFLRGLDNANAILSSLIGEIEEFWSNEPITAPHLDIQARLVTTNRLLRVFLCHASNDKPAVRELFNALKLQDWIDPWLDKMKILPGQNWRVVIEEAVEESDVVIICISNHSVNKEGFVQKEIRYAYDIALEKPEGVIFLIPLRLEECNVPRGMRSLQWVDYFGAEKEDQYSNLLEALKLRHKQKIGTSL